MSILTIQQALKNIEKGKTFEAELDNGSLHIKVTEYVPFIGTALHQGHLFPAELEPYCNLTSSQRYHEEDPFTGDLISSLPIVLTGQDSRYFYDLNRDLEECIYDTAWGKKVWRKKIPPDLKKEAHARHKNFYSIFKSLVRAIVQRCGSCVVFDIHSYNVADREYVNPPTFNLGTRYIEKSKNQRFISKYKDALKQIAIPNVDVTVSENEIYIGNGYLAEFAYKHIDKCLVLPLEIKKVFADETKPLAYPLVMDALKSGLHKAILATSIEFTKIRSTLKKASKSNLLPSSLDKVVLHVDRQIYHCAKGLNTLSFVNPINLVSERKKFISSRSKATPNFKYRQLHINPYSFKEALYRLPVEEITDLALQKLYKSVVDSLATKIELLASVGTNQFLYNSLKYFGEPSKNDIRNAEFILHLLDEETPPTYLDVDEVVSRFEEYVKHYNLTCKVELSSKIVAKALVSNTKKAVIINKDIQVTQNELQALMNHEVGVHMVTSINAAEQPLKLLRVGLPLNTLTQEGLAILSEYLSGFLSIKRLKTLALRVVVVKLMINGYDFKKVFQILVDDYGLNTEDAFTMTTRIYRGGGFTKDYLYLRGFKLAHRAFSAGDNINDLLVGKTSFEYQPEISELIERDIFTPPEYKTKSFLKPEKEDPVLSYIVRSIT